MNNQTAYFKLIKMEKDLAALNDKVDHQSALLKDLIQLLAPSFSTVEGNDISHELITASTQAKEDGIANSLNPDLMGKRDIPKVLEEVSKAFQPTNRNTFPGPQLRLLGLINHFKKENGVTRLLINDRSNLNDYKILKTVARRIHDEMVEEIHKELRKESKPVILPPWSEVSSEIISRYSYKLEKTAGQHGFNLSRCQHSWASLLLLSETHKHRSNRSRNKAAVFGESLSLNLSSSYSSIVHNIDAVREERRSSDYVDLNFDDEIGDMLEDDFRTVSLPHSPSPQPTSSPPYFPSSSKRIIAIDDDPEESVIQPSSKNRQNKRKK